MKMKLTTMGRRHIATLLMSFFLCSFVVPVFAQDNQPAAITGIITDSNKLPLIGVSVVEKGTTNGVTTDGNGRYSIQVKPGATLDFSYIGFKPISQVTQGRTEISLSMDEDALMIGEVVAIGYGSQRKEDLSMSVSTIKLDQAAKSRSSNLANLLQGRMPGVTVQQTGDPMRPASFSIRGRGSKGNDDDPTSGDGVLFVVDGVPGAPYMTEDIETITVLKDAASAAIYGAQVGSSGVILITTKKAEAGKARVDVNVSFGLQQVTNMPSLLTAEQYNNVWKKAYDNSDGTKPLPGVTNPELYPWGNVTRTNWLDEIFRTALNQHYAVSVSGGSDKLSSTLSLSYDNNEGVLLNTYSKVINAKLQTDYKIRKWLKISERLSFQHTKGQGNVNTSHEGPIMGAMWYPRSASVYEMNEDGSYALDSEGNKQYGGTAPAWAGVSGYPNIYNPVADLQKMHRQYPETRFYSTTSLEIKPITSLTIKSDFTADIRNKEDDEFYPKMTQVGLQRTENFREQFFYDDSHWLSETTIAWAQVFGKHHISAMAGFTADYKKVQTRSIYTRKYASEDEHGLTWDNAADWTERKPTERIKEYTLMSGLARVGYSFDDRYFFVGSIRRDASSKLPKTKNYDYFPAVSGSWKVSSEKFFSNAGLNKVFDMVKLRGGWGKVGNVDLYTESAVNVPMLSYEYPAIFGQDLNNMINGSYLSTIPNYNARWEVTKQGSAGLDLSMFNNSLDISVDYYHKVTSQLVDEIPTPEHIGVVNAPMGNMGNVLNEGWEISVNYNGHTRNNKLTYNIWGMFSTNNGYVREYGIRKDAITHKNPNLDSQPLLYSLAGEPWYSFKVYQTAGIFKSYDDINKHIYKNPMTGEAKVLQPNATPGDLIFIDANNDGEINEADRTFAGSYAPKNTFSFGGSLNWKGFDFSFFFQGVSGNMVYNGMKQMGMNGRQQGGNMVTDVLDTFDFNPDGKYPRLGLLNDTNGNYLKHTDIFLEKGDYLRLKNITLGYTLPQSISRYVGLNNGSLRVYVSIDNVATITGYSGIDPEVGNYGIDRGVYPLSRFFNFGLNINF